MSAPSKDGGKKGEAKPEGIQTRNNGARGAIGSRSPVGAALGTSLSRIPERKVGGTSGPAIKPADLQTILDKIDVSTKQLTESIDASSERTEKIAEEQKRTKEVTDGLKTQVRVQGVRLSDVEDKIEQLERDKRRSTLIIEGVHEVEGESVSEIVDGIFKDVGVSYTTRACVNIFRRGARVTDGRQQTASRQAARSGPRPIVVVFLRQTEKRELFGNLKNLKGQDKWNKVYFNDDWTEAQAIEQRDLRALAAYARNKGREAIVKGGVLWLEGRRFRYEDLFKLPEDISLLKAKTLNILDGKGIVFQSPHSPLSNLFPINLSYRGNGFLSAEGAFQFSHAMVAGQEKLAEQIKSEKRPYKVKKLAREIKFSQDWEDIQESVMREILLLKFTTDKFCNQFLLGTKNNRLFEGTGDKKWGCGIPIAKFDQITLKNPGRNILGNLLESIREEIRPK